MQHQQISIGPSKFDRQFAKLWLCFTSFVVLLCAFSGSLFGLLVSLAMTIIGCVYFYITVWNLPDEVTLTGTTISIRTGHALETISLREISRADKTFPNRWDLGKIYRTDGSSVTFKTKWAVLSALNEQIHRANANDDDA